MSGAIHWVSSKRHEAGISLCADGDAIAGPKHEQLRRAKGITGNLDLAGNGIDASLIIEWIERHRRPGGKADVCV